MEAGDYSFIYSVNGIGLEHSVALRLKLSTGLPWVAEFRDPWIHNVWEWQSIKEHSWGWWCRHEFKRMKELLRAIVDNADLVVVESPAHAELLITDFDLDAGKVAPLGTGFEPDYIEDMPKELVKFPARPVIGFVGRTYYGYQRAIKNLIDALRVLELDGHRFTLVSVGSDPTFCRFATEVKLEQFLPIDNVNYLRALSVMNELDFGIVATCEECLSHVNSKLWEYLALGLSILAIAPNEGSMAAIVKEGNCGYMLPYDNESMLLVLRSLLNDYEDGRARRASAEFRKSLSRKTTVAELAKKIEQLL